MGFCSPVANVSVQGFTTPRGLDSNLTCFWGEFPALGFAAGTQSTRACFDSHKESLLRASFPDSDSVRAVLVWKSLISQSFSAAAVLQDLG